MKKYYVNKRLVRSDGASNEYKIELVMVCKREDENYFDFYLQSADIEGSNYWQKVDRYLDFSFVSAVFEDRLFSTADEAWAAWRL